MDPQRKGGRLLKWHFEGNASINSDFDFLILEKLVGVTPVRFCHYFTRMVKQLMQLHGSSISANPKGFPAYIPPLFLYQPERQCLASWNLGEKGDVGSWVLNFSSHQPVKPRST
jgi:hypothetical protein